MIALQRLRFENIVAEARKMLLVAPVVDVGRWQSQDISDKPEMVTRELFNFSFQYDMPNSIDALVEDVKPNLPWANDHFRERVSGEPLNPPPSEAWWPYAQQGNAAHKADTKFSHTYPERIWPKEAGWDSDMSMIPHHGIRYKYGDLSDVVELLKREPMTRQAFLPIWFPEDTGAVEGQRVPCTLGYHFIIRNGLMHIVYYIRSCDFVRHFRDDVYMAVRLAEWVAYQIERERETRLPLGTLTMHITSFHVFEGDMAKLRFDDREYDKQKIAKLMGGF